MRVSRYIDYIKAGRIVPAAVPVVEQQRGATALVNGRWAFGQVGAWKACALAVELAEVQGVGAVALHNVMHIGRLGEYVEKLARDGWVTLILTSNGGPENAVAPYGGRSRIFGTNPMAFGCPGVGTPVVVDFATSATAEGKLALARSKGERLAPGLVVDRRGRPTADPAAFYEGGALLPFGGHKGYGLQVVIEVLARIMTGYVALDGMTYTRRIGNAVFVLVCDPRNYIAPERLSAEMRKLARAIRTAPTASGHTEVLLPGEPEARTRAERSKAGVPLQASLWEELQELASRDPDASARPAGRPGRRG